MTNAHGGFMHDTNGAHRWILREQDAGVQSAALYYSVDVRYGATTNSANQVMELFSPRSGARLVPGNAANAPYWDSTNAQMIVDATSAAMKMYRTNTINITTQPLQTYQFRRLSITANGDGCILSHNPTGLNNFQIRMDSNRRFYVRWSDSSGNNYDIHLRTSLAFNTITDITIGVNRTNGYVVLYCDGQWMESTQFSGDIIPAIVISSSEHGLYAEAGQALTFRLSGLTAVSGLIPF